jgi:hypothetical protein
MQEHQESMSSQDVLCHRDLDYLRRLGKTKSEVSKEYECLVHGIPHQRLKRPCSAGDGILRLDLSEEERYAQAFLDHADHGRAMKFVAASGAASRMFQSQISYWSKGDIKRQDLLADKALGNRDADELLRFIENLPRLPFFDKLKTTLSSRGLIFEDLCAKGSYSEILHCLLSTEGLGYAHAPKGLIPFHAYPSGCRDAFEEHLLEAATYVRNRQGIVGVHFTVPPGDEASVRHHLLRFAARWDNDTTRYAASVSAQDRSTDSIALGNDDLPVRNKDGILQLWPSGHGALLKNLNDLHGDIIFVRTVDNILPDRLKERVAFFKRVLGGLLIVLQEKVFSALEAIGSAAVGEKGLQDMEEWSREFLNLRLSNEGQYDSRADRAQMLFTLLNRPLRVCAMVRNEGEPGGSPFWVEGGDGRETVQIVESAQVDMSSDQQARIWRSSGYFNPVDIVCGVRDYRGEPFDLTAYADLNARFIAVKRFGGNKIRAMERPGLWNGSMAFWNTVLVETPRETFHPVKNVMDLLSPNHQV